MPDSAPMILPPAGRAALSGAPDGAEAWALRLLARTGGAKRIVFVARDAERRARVLSELAAFLPEAQAISLPAWDCLPYDRSSPNREIVSERMRAFRALAALDDCPVDQPVVLATTVNAILQRIPPVDALAAAVDIKPGGRFDEKAFQAFVSVNGYQRADTVMEPGEFAIRGSLVDIFPAGAEFPARIDLFGDEVEAIKSFDPLTQRSEGVIDHLSLAPASEAPLDTAAIERFRGRYREAFGADALRDPLYESVSAGRRHPGMEHWLPLFHDSLASLFELIPNDAVVVLDQALDDAAQSRIEAIADHFLGRAEILTNSADEQPYRPLQPDALYLTPDEWTGRLAEWRTLALDPFLGADGAVSARARAILDFAEARARSDADLYSAVAERFALAAKSGQRAVLAASTDGALDRLRRLVANDGGYEAIQVVATVDEALALPKGVAGAIVAEMERGFETDSLVVVTEQDILGERLQRRQRRRKRADTFLTEASESRRAISSFTLIMALGAMKGWRQSKPAACRMIACG